MILRMAVGGFLGLIILAMIPLSLMAQAARDDRAIGASGLPLPRYMSLKSDDVNMRRGPGRDYPIKWKYQRRHLPVQIVAEYGQWRQIQDHEGSEGWVYAPLLSGTRHVLFRDAANAIALRSRPEASARMLALVQPGVIASLEECEGEWCEVEVNGQDGWVGRDQLWGLYEFEYRD